jgi:glycerol kinase
LSDGLLLGIDEGTTAVKVALFDLRLRVVAQSRREVPVSHPGPGLVEQDPLLILEAVTDAVAEVLMHSGSRGREVLGAGIDHQGESVLAWHARSGAPLSQVIVWQDKRQEEMLAGIDPLVQERSGLPLDPYFSAGKLSWLLGTPEVDSAREQGALRMGTVDAFLVERLGGRFATDLSTASRTQLIEPCGRDWDEQLLRAFGLQRQWLPPIRPSFGALGVLRSERWPVCVPLTAQLVDQQAALAGSGAVRPGELKATYGTGVFVLGRTRDAARAPGLLPTVAWAGPGATQPGPGEAQPAHGSQGARDEPAATREADAWEVAYALDGGVFSAGSLLDWLAGGLGLADSAGELARAAAGAGESAGVMVLPALAGLGAPWWAPRARGVIAGLHAGVTAGNVGWAALEAIAWRVADIVEAMGQGDAARELRVDGGLARDKTLLALQADALGLPLRVGEPDGTVLGAAMLAGVGAGVFADVEAAAKLLPAGRVVQPGPRAAERAAARERWRGFVRASATL